MSLSKARYVTACQQSLALGAVLAVLAPAASVISLDVVQQPAQPVTSPAERPALEGQQPTRTGRAPVSPPPEPAPVATAPVEPEVRELPLELRPGAERPRAAPRVSEPAPVEGYGAVGVTWSPESEVEDDEITVRVRTRTDEEWSDWRELEYHDEHAPDAGTEEARNARPGTEPMLVGEVDEVQAKAVTDEGVAAPIDLQLAVVEPGEGETAREEPAIDTAELADEPEDAVALRSAASEPEPAVELQVGGATPKPRIFSRAQWGADERLRDGSPNYYEVHAGFVHHTVNANDYTRAQVPGIIRSIYAYHTRTRGWSDVGYNFLVDRFGRIWEGRAGGVDRPVVGAHTRGYNQYSFAMSAIGNFDVVRPSSRLLEAYGRLFAWKLSLHGVDATAPSQRVGARSFPAINGHRDAGSTACPGRHLYARLGDIRNLAERYQADWSGRQPNRDVAGSPYPDLLLRKRKSQNGFVLPTEGLLRWRGARTAGTGYADYDVVLASPDLTGDGHSDLFVRKTGGASGVRPGDGRGGFGPTIRVNRAFDGRDQIAAVGDLDGDGANDLVARNVRGTLQLFRGKGNGDFSRTRLSRDWDGYDLTVGTGDFDRDGEPDLLARAGNRLWLHPGTGTSSLGERRRVNGRHWADWDTITGFGDFSGDGRADLYVRDPDTRRGHVYLGRGRGKVRKDPLGPFGRVGRVAHLSGGTIAAEAAPDLVGVKGDRLVVVQHMGTFNTSRRIKLGDAFAGADEILNVGDWDGDGFGDVISRVDGRLRLHRGQATERLAPPMDLAGGFRRVRLLAAVGDVTGDGRPDLMGQPAGAAMRIYPGDGVGGLGRSYVARSSISASEQFGLGLWDDDGTVDNAFRVDDRLVWYRGNGPGGLTGPQQRLRSVDLAPYDLVVAAGDVIGGSRTDLVARRADDGTLWVLKGKRSGFGSPKFLAGRFRGYDLIG